MERLDQIVPDIVEGKCILFIGAGISRIAGCGDWDSMVRKMLRHPVIRQKLDMKGDYEIIRKTRHSNEDWIDFCEGELTRNGKVDDFLGTVRETLTKDPQRFVTEYLPLVRKIAQINPLPKIITTNIDNCIEEARIVNFNKIFYKPGHFAANNLKGNETAIFHIHGYIEELERSLLTKKSYLRRYNDSRFKGFLKTIFSDYSVLFLGYSLRDSPLRDIMRQTQNNRRHFALVAQEDGFEPWDISPFFDLFGVQVVIYGSQNDFIKLFAGWIDKNFGGPDINSEGEHDG